MSTLHGTLNPWTADELSRIHQASLSVLEKTGAYVDSDRVLDFLEQTEARVDRQAKTVRFPGDLVERQLREAPGSWDRRAVSRGMFSVSADCGSDMIWDHEARGARSCGRSDLIDVPRLVEAMEHIDEAGNLVFPQDVPAPLQDMITYRYMWQHTQKEGGGGLGRCPSCMRVCSPRVFDDLCNMLEVKRGKEGMKAHPEFSFFMGVASPLRFGSDVLELALHSINRGQVVGIGGNCICGIQSPVTAASNIVIDHAERLAGLCIVTAINPKAKFYFCNHTYFLDMQSG
ncbi:MAG: hypothetical protein HN368_08915, partial [Spirochaetales bacterium]|nr:hypothetical protein [Spirochaetales bacterium]